MKTFDISRLPPMITLGYDGENNWRPNRFDCSALLANHPNGTISLWLLPKGETQAFPVALERDGDSVVWTPLAEEMTAATGALQLVCTDGTDVGKSAVVMFRVDESILPGAVHPSEVPSWATQTIERAESAADRAEEAADSIDAEHLEQTIATAVEDYLEEHPVEITETDPTVPAWAKQPTKPTYTSQEVGALPSSYTPPVVSVNGKTGAVALGAADVHALPDSTVIPVVPQMATDANMSDWEQGKTVDAAVLKADFQQALALVATKANADDVPTAVSDLANDSGYQTAAQVQSAIAAAAELPSGGTTGDFLRKTASGVAWQTVPSAESNSFGGGS